MIAIPSLVAADADLSRSWEAVRSSRSGAGRSMRLKDGGGAHNWGSDKNRSPHKPEVSEMNRERN
jgi:hypothetical protein